RTRAAGVPPPLRGARGPDHARVRLLRRDAGGARRQVPRDRVEAVTRTGRGAGDVHVGQPVVLKKRAVGEAAQELVAGVRFLWRLPAFLRHPIDPERARAILRRRLETRETGFLDLARRAIFDQRVSPYRRLLAAAGFEYGDLERLVHRDGVDTALEVLLRHGVYLRVDEFKGRRAAARGGRTIDVRPSDLRNPFLRVDMLSQTGGSGGPSTPVAMDLGFIGEMAVNYSLVNQARGAEQWVHAVWLVPAGDAIVKILPQTRCGPTPVRWFSPLPLAALEGPPRYRWGARLLRYAGTLARVPLPWPEHVPIEHPAPIVEWMHGVLRAGRTPHLMTIASSAVHVCRAAAEVGVDLRGAQFTLTGEPTTPARLAALRDVGAVAYPFYATTEAGLIGLGCRTPETPDDVHLFHDRVAVIKSAEASAAEGLPTDALYVSSLRVTGSAVILLNVSLGDCAVLTSRRCGCPLESLGWNRHLHTIRS